MQAFSSLKQRLISLLRWSERYTKTDMVYLASGAFWSNLNMVVVTGMAFALSLMFARFLSKDAYGTYQYSLSIAGLIGAATMTGMNSAVARAVARGHEAELGHSVRYQIYAGAIPAAIGLCVAGWYFVHGNMQLGFVFGAISILLPIGNALNTWSTLLGGRKQFRVSTYYGLANNVISYAGIMLALFFTRNFLWVILANFLFSFLANLIMYKLVLKRHPPNSERDPETIPYGTHLSIMNIPGTIAGQLDSLLIFHFVGAASLAVYSFATIIPERLAGILKFLPNLAVPKLATKDEAGIRLFLARRFWPTLVLCACAAGAYALCAPLLFHIFFPAYSDSIAFTQVYALSFFSLPVTVLQSVLTAQKKTRELYITSTASPAIRIVLMIVLMYFYGIWGLLWAQILVNFAYVALQLVLIYKPARQIA